MNEQAQMLSNRVLKNTRHRKKWARRNNITCYRLYDRDIPEIPLAIDWYEGKLHISEFARQSKNSTDSGDEWLKPLVDAVAQSLDIKIADVFVKYRDRQRGLAQYERVAHRHARFQVSEGGHKFWVNLSDYTDTGLFLDHRITRSMFQSEAHNKRVLNLFAYTGAFTVYAAAGGAKSSTTVDLSNTYLDWAHRNLVLNELNDPKHEFVRMDVTSFLEQATNDGLQFDLAIVDPPTFSNSKRMETTFDVQRDHTDLLKSLMPILSKEAVIYFSTNNRRFKLSDNQLHWVDVVEVTKKTVPKDFSQKRPHQCWRMERK